MTMTPELARLREKLAKVHDGAYVTVVFSLALPRVTFAAGDQFLAVDSQVLLKLASGPSPRRSACDAAREILRFYSGDRMPTARVCSGTIAVPAAQLAVRHVAIHTLNGAGCAYDAITPTVPLFLWDVANLDVGEDAERGDDEQDGDH